MTKTMKINELVSKLKEYDGELPVKVWSGGANKAYPISHVGQGHTDGELDTYVSIVVDDDDNLVDTSKIWHDASEMPVDNSRIVILYQYEIEGFNDVKMRDFPIHYFAHYDWARIVKRNFIKKWAYVSDLLPKGGKK